MRRSESLLKEIASDSSSVKYQATWPAYYIETGISELLRIGLPYHTNLPGPRLELSLFYGDTMKSAKAFYERAIPFSFLLSLQEKGWRVVPNFHLAQIQRNILWISTEPQNIEIYFQHWLKNKNGICEVKRSEILQTLRLLEKELIISITDENYKEIERLMHFQNQTFRIIPGLALIYDFFIDEAIKLDYDAKLGVELWRRIKEGVECLGDSPSFLLIT